MRGMTLPPFSMPLLMPTPEAVLDFWFGPTDAPRKEWFVRSDAFDADITQRFGPLTQAALRGDCAAWDDTTATGRLATILVLDQFTRNIFRGTPRAFAGDAQALALARQLIDSGQHLALPPLRRWFAYMPLEHAEHLPTQDDCVQRFIALAADAGPHSEALAGALDYAERHRAVIRRFGRFPHRNEILGRESTPEEVEFLKQPGSRF
jgi:uncharacterized protein (DUF924 family)